MGNQAWQAQGVGDEDVSAVHRAIMALRSGNRLLYLVYLSEASFSRIEKIIERQVFPEVRKKHVRNTPPLVRGPALEFINRNRLEEISHRDHPDDLRRMAAATKFRINRSVIPA